jgi:dethiobiotin synthetase
MRAFITATGTEIGKTHVTCELLRRLRSQGEPTLALKPVVTGFDPASPAGSDPVRLLEAQGLEPTPDAIAAISPWRFAAPLRRAARVLPRPLTKCGIRVHRRHRRRNGAAR